MLRTGEGGVVDELRRARPPKAEAPIEEVAEEVAVGLALVNPGDAETQTTGIATVGAGSECFANRCEATETLACDVPLNVASFPVEGRLLVL